MKKIICRICQEEIKVGEKLAILDGFLGHFETYHKHCLEYLIKSSSNATNEDVEEYGYEYDDEEEE